MSMLPYLVNNLVRDIYDPLTSLYDQHFGVGLFNDELSRCHIADFLAPQRRGRESGICTISNQKDQFKVNLDVQQFKPEEVNVKIADGYLVVEGKHEEKQDKHGFISRQFTRRYKLPENVNLEAIQSHLSSDGILSIAAPKKLEQNAAKEIPIPIQQTNAPAIKQTNSAENKSSGNGDEKQS